MFVWCFVFSDRLSTTGHCHVLYKDYIRLFWFYKYFYVNHICDIWTVLLDTVVVVSHKTIIMVFGSACCLIVHLLVNMMMMMMILFV